MKALVTKRTTLSTLPAHAGRPHAAIIYKQALRSCQGKWLEVEPRYSTYTNLCCKHPKGHSIDIDLRNIEKIDMEDTQDMLKQTDVRKKNLREFKEKVILYIPLKSKG